VDYAELHCHSNLSFLDGAAHPEELVAEAARLGLSALALTDHGGLYGAVRFAEAAREAGLPTVFGAELTFGAGPRAGGGSGTGSLPQPDPPGAHLVVLARDEQGYRRLSRAIAEAHLAGGKKGTPKHDLTRLAELAGGHLVVLTGCRKGTVPAALVRDGPAAAERALAELVAHFGRPNVAVELFDHGDPLDQPRNDALAGLAVRHGLDLVATNVVHYATVSQRRLATALAATRSRRSLAEIDGWLPGGAGAHLRSPAEQAQRLARYPGAVARAAELGAQCAFDLHLVAPKLPDFAVPTGESESSHLRHLVEAGALRRYGARGTERVPGAWAQLDHELEIVEALGFAGYFLVVHDVVEFCRREQIYCQGRGSAANSAVCYVLGITNADAVALGLLFERFLSPERDGPPDIDVDIESGRREEVIQYLYARHGRERAAQVANVITYRARSAVRDAGRALGHPPAAVDTWARRIEGWQSLSATADAELPADVARLARELEGVPRHLGIHSGGMVLCDRPVVEVCPVEWARRAGRTVLQWDKEDCAAAGLVKFDLLGLGMLEVLHRSVDLIEQAHGVEIDLALIEQEPEVYELLSRADTVGVFQVESRAQMATLPRLRPRCFYDLVVEVALIRPGPIQGGSVHPYLRRRNGTEEVTYPHPLLEPCLRKTLGVPLFQEQLMQISIDAAGFSAAEADQLRQAMGSKRSAARMERLRARLFAGMAERGITGTTAEEIFEKLSAFSSFGFPESHSVSFAYLVYVSAWCKLHYPAAFLAALLNSQPMGFWPLSSLVADARRHGVRVLSPDICCSGAKATLERVPGDDAGAAPAVRLGLGGIRGIGGDLAVRIVAERAESAGPYRDLEDLARRCQLKASQLEALALSGALDRLVVDEGSLGEERNGRRRALWAAGAAAESARSGRLPGLGPAFGGEVPELPSADQVDDLVADYLALGCSPRLSPLELCRAELSEQGVRSAVELCSQPAGSRVEIAGVVTHRQRPPTAKGVTFLNLEDETGLVNVVCSRGVWTRYRTAARDASVLRVRGRVERADGAVTLVAERIEELELAGTIALGRSRNFS
jgi:error-prone DNA polymerase